MTILVILSSDTIKTIVAVVYIVTGEAIMLLEYLGFATTGTLFLAVDTLLYIKWKKLNVNGPVKVSFAFLFNWSISVYVLARARGEISILVSSLSRRFHWSSPFCAPSFWVVFWYWVYTTHRIKMVSPYFWYRLVFLFIISSLFGRANKGNGEIRRVSIEIDTDRLIIGRLWDSS